MAYFQPYLALMGGKTLKNRSNNQFGPMLGTFKQLFASFAIFAFFGHFGDFFTL
jgi:hypothetical protein